MTSEPTPKKSKKPSSKKSDIGIIVGRFQVDRLHDMHCALIEKVMKEHGKVAIFLGVSPVLGSMRNPLDFPTREAMIKKQYPTAVVVPIPDRALDIVWSDELDRRIRELFPVGSVCLYGGRDSFLKHYFGNYKTCEIDPGRYVSGTDIRKRISTQIMGSDEFRAGVIYATYAQYPHAYPTVDIAVLRHDDNDKKLHAEVLLARKPDEKLFRFVGGFVDPTDKCLEDAAKRELNEEAGVNLNVGEMSYVCSDLVSDWRYARENCKIMTSFFVTSYCWGMPQPGDDIEELQWFPLVKNLHEKMVYTHQTLISKLIEFIQHSTVDGKTYYPRD